MTCKMRYKMSTVGFLLDRQRTPPRDDFLSNRPGRRQTFKAPKHVAGSLGVLAPPWLIARIYRRSRLTSGMKISLHIQMEESASSECAFMSFPTRCDVCWLVAVVLQVVCCGCQVGGFSNLLMSCVMHVIGFTFRYSCDGIVYVVFHVLF